MFKMEGLPRGGNSNEKRVVASGRGLEALKTREVTSARGLFSKKHEARFRSGMARTDKVHTKCVESGAYGNVSGIREALGATCRDSSRSVPGALGRNKINKPGGNSFWQMQENVIKRSKVVAQPDNPNGRNPQLSEQERRTFPNNS